MNFFRRIKYFIQRGKNGYSSEDTWNFSDYLCTIIPPAVRKLKDSMGCPGNVYDKKRVNDECWKWKEILESIAQGFEAAREIMDVNYFKKIKVKGQPYYTQEIDKKKAENLAKKYNRGLDLFRAHFLNLWD